ncbi:ATP-binding protein [Duodenibacillus massiliensis]|uniref:ATP-binding protein n=1 Tax=Duodenibacillus massiliensis TaxID=1852381 RepID=UPI00307C7B45
MTYIKRTIAEDLMRQTPPKAVVIYGARRTGKTTVLRELLKDEDVVWYSGDEPDDREMLRLNSASDVKALLTRTRFLVIDEAQRIPDIGLTLKRLVDMNETLKEPTAIFVTGSSALTLAAGVKESAMGRLVHRQLWPLSLRELAQSRGKGKTIQNLGWHMVYGLFPEVCNKPEEAADTLTDYVDSLLFKDLFALAGVRMPLPFENLVKHLALNIGSEVSFDGLAREVGLARNTVEQYVRLLEECFIVKVCPSYSRNPGNALKKGRKIYFCDTGIRNAVIKNFDPLSSREDAGALWENFFYMERIKLHSQLRDLTEVYFWRTTGRSPREIDLVEVGPKKINAFECKLSPTAPVKGKSEFLSAFKDANLYLVTPKDIRSPLFDDEGGKRLSDDKNLHYDEEK